jgi:hypothetical protein
MHHTQVVDVLEISNPAVNFGTKPTSKTLDNLQGMQLLLWKTWHLTCARDFLASKKWGFHQLAHRLALREKKSRAQLKIGRFVSATYGVSYITAPWDLNLRSLELKWPVSCGHRLQYSWFGFQQLVVYLPEAGEVLLPAAISAPITTHMECEDVTRETIRVEILSKLTPTVHSKGNILIVNIPLRRAVLNPQGQGPAPTPAQHRASRPEHGLSECYYLRLHKAMMAGNAYWVSDSHTSL